jgi:two-component sensor histidine kinase
MTRPVPSSFNDRLLLRELAHRVNNEFTSIINTISLAAARSSHCEVKVALNAAMELLHGYADVHRALQMPKPDAQVDAADFLDALCAAMSRSKLERMGISLVLRASVPLRLSSERCWRLGLIVYELVTNAVRHAFNGRAGEIRIELKFGDGLVRCKVTDNGSASSNIRPGQGLEIVRQLANDLGGTVQHCFEQKGSTSLLVFSPL